MNSHDFVAAIERHVRDAAICDTLSNLKAPPGRRLPQDIRTRSEWYNQLSESDTVQVNSVISSAVHAALFGFLAALDGARTIDDGTGHFELSYVVDTDRVLLNPPTIDLHDLLNSS